MSTDIKVAIIGLDTSHSIEFVRRFQATDCPADQKLTGARASACLRFDTPFQNQEGLDNRQKQLEAWGVKVTPSFDEAIEGCDAIALEINDPAFHLEYFKKVAGMGKPVFLDKPLAGTVAEGRAILRLIAKRKTRVMSCSSLRFGDTLEDALKQIPQPELASVFGAMGKAPAGDSLVWYGVHAFEMLERAMGRGAVSVWARENETGVVTIVDYGNSRQGIVEARCGHWAYGGRVQSKEKVIPFVVDSSRLYTKMLESVMEFFRGAPPPVSMEDAFEVLAMMEAARRSIKTRKAIAVPRL